MHVKKLWRFIAYSLSIEKTRDSVKVANLGKRDLSMSDVQGMVPKDEARWIIYDYDYEKNDTGIIRKLNKLLFIIYNSDSNPDRQ